MCSGACVLAIEERFRGKGYADFKRELADVIVEGLRPIRERYHQLREDPGYLEGVLHEGAERARPMANAKLALVKERVGLG